MRVTEANVGFISDPEVLNVLKERSAGESLSSKALQVEKQAYTYLSQQYTKVPTRQQIQDFVSATQAYKLSKTEVLQLLNLAPTSLVEVYLIIEEFEARLQESDAEQLLALVQQHLKQ